MNDSRRDDALVVWETLSGKYQLALREAHDHYLDTLPPTCSLDTWLERFRARLEVRGIRYTGTASLRMANSELPHLSGGAGEGQCSGLVQPWWETNCSGVILINFRSWARTRGMWQVW